MTLTAFGIWITIVAGWLALSLYLFLLTAISFTIDVATAARRIDDEQGGK
jgi:hypothetical protein